MDRPATTHRRIETPGQGGYPSRDDLTEPRPEALDSVVAESAATGTVVAEDRNPAHDATWRAILEGTDPRYRTWHGMLKRLPASRRCHMCAAPFQGPAAPFMRFLGRAPWHRNPNFCSAVLYQQDGIIDKFVGDEVVAIFIPALAQDAHAGRAVAAAEEILRATGHGTAEGPWAPVGVGIATGVAYVWAVGSGEHSEFTALGDIVNTAARLAGAASAGEILLTVPALDRSNIDAAGLGRARHRYLTGASRRHVRRRRRRRLEQPYPGRNRKTRARLRAMSSSSVVVRTS